MNMKYSLNPLDYIPHLILGVIIGIAGLLGACAINHIFGEQTVLDTFPGTKSVCAQQQYNYSTKTTQCVRHATVPATCKKVEYRGPIFDTYISTNCD
jgi:hypothetical protein